MDLTLEQVGEIGLTALTIWREASNQSPDVMLAVAWSIKNRVDSPRWWGSTFQQVIGKRLQYSSMTAGGDPNLLRWPVENDASWQNALDAAEKVVTDVGLGIDPTNGADSYFDKSLDTNPPKWSVAPGTQHTADLGAFHFFKSPEVAHHDAATA